MAVVFNGENVGIAFPSKTPTLITKEINEMKKLHHIEHLLLDLLKFVFHFHDDALHLGMV